MEMNMSKKKSLGRGLSALLGPDAIYDGEVRVSNYRTMDIHKLKPGKYQVRKSFSEVELNELAASIKEIGILQPIVVRELDDSSYEIVAGERRWRAAQLAGLAQVPISFKEFSDDQACEAGLIENIQRDDLNPLEEAEGFRQVMEQFNLTQEQLAEKIGKSRSYIANTIRLLKLPESIKEQLITGKISAAHARTLLKAENAEEIANEIVEKQINVREIEQRVRHQRNPIPSAKKDEDILILETQVAEIFSTKAEIDMAGQKGVIHLYFKDLQDLDRIISIMADAAAYQTNIKRAS